MYENSTSLRNLQLMDLLNQINVFYISPRGFFFHALALGVCYNPSLKRTDADI